MADSPLTPAKQGLALCPAGRPRPVATQRVVSEAMRGPLAGPPGQGAASSGPGPPSPRLSRAAQGSRLGGGRWVGARAWPPGSAGRCCGALCWRHPALQLPRGAGGVGGGVWAGGLPGDLCVTALALGLGQGAHGTDCAGLAVLSRAVAQGPAGRGLGLPLLTPVCHRPRPRGARGGARGPGGPGSPAAGEAAQPPLSLRPAGRRRYGHPWLTLSLRSLSPGPRQRER